MIVQFGVNTFVWESPFTTETASALAAKASRLGFDVLELACEQPELIDVPRVREILASHRLQAIVCGAFGPGRDLSSDDETVRASAKEFVRWLIDAAAELGSPLVCGPMYSQTGKARLVSPDVRTAERRRAAEALTKLGDYAAKRGVRLAIEPLNRFETDMVNTTEQALALIEETGSSHIGVHLDTFHMHIEEKSSADAVRLAGRRLFHVHACENDRGVPGTGQIAWQAVADALRDIQYDGAVVIESFTPKVRSIAQAVSLWRPIAPDQDSIARDGLQFLKRLFDM